MAMTDFQPGIDGLRKEGELIAPFYPLLKEKCLFLNPSGEVLGKEYHIAIIYKGRELETFSFKSLNNICYSEYWDECCDAELSNKHRKALHVYLQYCAKETHYTKYYHIDQTGLLGTSPVIFAYGYDAIITPDIFPLVCSPHLPVFEIRKEIETSCLLNYAENLIKLEPEVTDLLFIIRAACVIRPIFKLQNYLADFFVSILGVSGTQKTTYAKMYFVENTEQFLSFSFSNKKLLQERLEKYSGHAVVIDDYHPMARNYDKEKQQAMLDVLARKADSGDGAIGVMTGEYMEGSFSLQDRMIPIYTRKKTENNLDFSRNLLVLANENYKLAALMYLFAQKAYINLESMTRKLDELISASGNGIVPYRIIRSLNILEYTWELFKLCFPESETFRAVNHQISSSIQYLLSKHIKYMEVTKRLEYEADMTREVYHMLYSSDVRRTHDISETLDYEGILLKDDCIYITKLALENEMNKFLGRPVKIEDIVSHLQKTSVLCEDNSTARTKKFKGKRFYVINRDKLRLYSERKTPDR